MLINCPECKREVSDTVGACPHCGYAIGKATPPLAPAETLDQQIKREVSEREKRFGTLFALALFAVVGFFVWRGCSATGSGSDGGVQCDEMNARVAAEQFVTDNVKSPSTAEFGAGPEWKITNTEGNRWSVVSWVDAQNAFGAVVRAKFHAVVVCKGDGNWTLESLTFD